jgi:hypothetical protein
LNYDPLYFVQRTEVFLGQSIDFAPKTIAQRLDKIFGGLGLHPFTEVR